MSASFLIACTNFIECDLAGKARWPEALCTCPNCGKSLASPHKLELKPRGAKKIEVVVTRGGLCRIPGKLDLLCDGEEYDAVPSDGGAPQPDPTQPEQEPAGANDALQSSDPRPPVDLGSAQTEKPKQEIYHWILDEQKPGVHRFRARLKSGDGYVSLSNEVLRAVPRPPRKLGPWVLILLGFAFILLVVNVVLSINR